MLTTNNLGLLKPELTDPADITALNANWDKIDDLPTRCKHVVDADLNTLLEEGMCYCTGTITNAPENTTHCFVRVVECEEKFIQIVYYIVSGNSSSYYRAGYISNGSGHFPQGWFKHAYYSADWIEDSDATLGGGYLIEVNDLGTSHIDGIGKIITISGSVANCDHLIKQINVGYEIKEVVSCMMTPNTDHGWMCVTPSISGKILSLTFDAYDDDAHIPCSYIVKLIV